MSTSKKGWRERPRPDRYSVKTEGKVSQTLRLDPEQNQLLRAASKLETMSINTWAVRILVKEARKIVAAAPPPPKPRKKAQIG